MEHPDQDGDAEAIMQVIVAESTAFWNKDYDAWARYWVQDSHVSFMGWWEQGGVTVVEGWEAVSAQMREVMTASPEPNPTAADVRREHVNVRVGQDIAWVTFDQYGRETGDQRMDMPGRSRETRILEKAEGAWKLAFVCWLLEETTDGKGKA